MPTKIGEYKGNKTISLMNAENDRYPFSFGLAKAKLILDNIDAIRSFALENSLYHSQDITDRQYEDQCQQITGA